jgi:hypothetical protein
MQMHYNLTADDIWNMSWRRFRVMFSKLFEWKDQLADGGSIPDEMGGSRRSNYERAVHEARGAASSISRSFDWDAALGREAPASREIITTEELLSGVKTAQGSRIET